jgi:hypothetical protein
MKHHRRMMRSRTCVMSSDELRAFANVVKNICLDEREWVEKWMLQNSDKTRSKWQTLDSQQPWFVATGNMGLHYMFACRPLSRKSLAVMFGHKWCSLASSSCLCPSWLYPLESSVNIWQEWWPSLSSKWVKKRKPT